MACSAFSVAVARPLHGDDPGARWVGQHVHQPDKGLFEEELHAIAVYHLDPVYGVEHIAQRIGPFRQEAIKGKLHILRHQLAAIHRRLIVPFDPWRRWKT